MYVSVSRDGEDSKITPPSSSCLPPFARLPSRLAILARMLELGLLKSNAREGTGSGAR